MTVAGVLFIVLGGGFGLASAIYSRTDWAWNHRNAQWNTGVNVSRDRSNQTTVWMAASLVIGVFFVAAGVVLLVHES